MPEFDSAYHRMRIDDRDGVRHLKFERNQQSSMRLDDPFATDIQYVGFLHTAVAVCPTASRALVLGLGGGSFVKQLWHDYPHMRVDAVEIDPDVVDVCRAYFALPDDDRISVHIAEGREFLESADAVWDLIIVDAFDDDRIPPHLLTEEFLRACRDRMSAGGAIAYNVIGAVYGSHSRPLRSLYRTLGNVWRHVWLFPLGLAEHASESTRNTVVLASDAPLTHDELAERIRGRVGGLVTTPGFPAFADELYRGPVRTGDVPILTDGRKPGRRERW